MSEPLIIHPDRLEDVGQKLANEPTYGKAISVIMRSLQHQSWLNKTWRKDEDEASHRFRSDQPDPLPRDGSNAI